MVDQESNGRVAKQVYWQDQMIQWRASGQSIRSFCASSNLSEASFSWWRRTLRKRGLLPDESKPVGNDLRIGDPKLDRLKSPKTFVPVQIHNDMSAVSAHVVDAGRIEVLLGTGHRLWVGDSVTKQSLATVVSVLEDR